MLSISKIFKRIIYSKLIVFLDRNGVFTSYQYDFRKGRSKINAIYSADTVVLESMQLNKQAKAICLDLTKAFDSVDHSTLVLERYEFYSITLKL